MDVSSEYAIEIAKLFPRQGEWTEEKYFSLPETNKVVELVDGDIIVSPSPTGKHAIAVIELATALKNHIDKHKLGVVLTAPMDVRLRKNLIRQPDVLFIRADNKDIIRDIVDGVPDWVAEVVSPGTKKTDEQDKLTEYAKAGVPEYWIIDPEAEEIKVYVLAGEADALTATISKAQTAESPTIEGFEVAAEGLFAS